MKYIKEKILYILLICLIILIIGITILFIINKKGTKENNIENNNIENNNKEIYGKWLAHSSQVFVNNEIKYIDEDFNGNYIIINEDNIDICYHKNDDLVCIKCNYKVENNKIITEGENAYLADINEYHLENEILIFKTEINDSKYVQLIFERDDSNMK